MGWNDWYTHYDRITDAKVREAAHNMIASGMADFGYQYVNIDDCWMVKPGETAADLGGRPRDDAGRIRPNGRFPDMRALTDSIHALGLKAGIYTSPGPLTCAGFTGSYQHEEQDARTFADWGFDFLKYDWCSYGQVAGGKDPESLRRPYRLMGGILRNLDRDMVFNLCQYGMGDVWTWGADVGGHCWRTTGDLGLEAGGRLPGFYPIGLSNARHWEQAGPGAWNDPDYLLIGRIGDARHQDRPPHATSLTGDEQYSYMAMWCLMAAPLIFSGDMGALDPFTLNVLCNAEVIAIDQDELGQAGPDRPPKPAGTRAGQAIARWLVGRRPVQPRRGGPGSFRLLGRAEDRGAAGRPGSLATERAAGARRRVFQSGRSPWRVAGPAPTR